jgi:hypothetical protein
MGYVLERKGSIPPLRLEAFVYSTASDRFWGPPSILSGGYREAKATGA